MIRSKFLNKTVRFGAVVAMVSMSFLSGCTAMASNDQLQALEESKKAVHQLHLENFFRAIRTGSELSCPPEVGFETAVSVLKANDAVEAARRIGFRPEDFVA